MKIVYTEKNSSWDICGDEKGYLWAVPNEEGKRTGAKFSNFGDKFHIRKLMGADHLNLDRIKFTEFGLELFEGFHSSIITDDDGNFKFSILTF